MAYKRGKYDSQAWQSIPPEQGEARQACKDNSEGLQALAEDIDPAKSPYGFTLPSGALFDWDQSDTCPAGSVEATEYRNEFVRGWDGTTVIATGGATTATATTGAASATTTVQSGTGATVASGTHTHGVTVNTLPPYRTCLKCRVL